MSEYQLEIQQLVSYPRCRIYREFLQTLTADRGVRTNGRPRMTYQLYPLSGDSKGMYERDTLVRRFCMDVLCSSGTAAYTFKLSTTSNTVQLIQNVQELSRRDDAFSGNAGYFL